MTLLEIWVTGKTPFDGTVASVVAVAIAFTAVALVGGAVPVSPALPVDDSHVDRDESR